jgi:molybdopterin molybdotransferase
MLLVQDIDQTRQLLRQHVRPLAGQEIIELAQAGGRVLAMPIAAARDVPPFSRSQVDGLAVRAADTFGASENLPALLTYIGEVSMGQASSLQLGPQQCIYVPTGGEIPAGADAMVMIEYVEDFGDGLRQVTHAVSPGAAITYRADDVAAGAEILPAGKRLTPADLGTLAALGISRVAVCPRPRIAILSTGDELVDVSGTAGPGQIYDVNRYTLAASVLAQGGEPVFYGIVPDELADLQETLALAIHDCDLVLVSGGSSVGTRDHVQTAINSLGQPGVIQHGVAVKPGKPTMIAVCDNKLVIGLPGHPVAAWFMFEWLVRPVISWLQGARPPRMLTVSAVTSSRIPSNHGREEFVPVRLLSADGGLDIGGPEDGTSPLVAEPVFTKSGLITLLSRSDGYIRIPRDCEGLPERSKVTVYLF